MLPDLAVPNSLVVPAVRNHFRCGMQGMMYL